MYKLIKSLPETELLAQLAEECSELAQAALKLRRAMDKTNPTPISREDARAKLIEEIADVFNCIDFIVKIERLDVSEMFQIVKDKRERWDKRLDASRAITSKLPQSWIDRTMSQFERVE